MAGGAGHRPGAHHRGGQGHEHAGKPGEPDGNCAIVTSEYHLYRAKALAARQGVECYGVAARTSWPTLMLNYFIREGFAVTYYRITGEI